MKIKLVLFLGCLGMLAGCTTNGNFFGRSVCADECPQNLAQYSCACQCTDPSCGTSYCLDSKECCRVFGNVGESNFDPAACCDTDERNYTCLANAWCSPTRFTCPAKVCNASVCNTRPCYK